MTKRIAVINDLSGFGRCSLVAAISVLSSMGTSACPLPTAVLTAQTGYDSYYCDDYTDKMDIYIEEWKKLNANFAGIYAGFLANEAQVDKILDFLSVFKKNETFFLVDPIMGDDGKTHGLFTEGLKRELKLLCKEASVITPNLTELCLLTDENYEDIIALKEEPRLIATLVKLGRKLVNRPDKHIIVTGISSLRNGKKYMGNLLITKDSYNFFAFPFIAGSYSGTGDLFASCLVGGMANNVPLDKSIKRAGNFIAKSIQDSVLHHVPYNDGVNFEKYLYLLKE